MSAVAKLLANYQPIPWSGCWIWTGPINDKGYGRFMADGVTRYAHRLSYEVHLGGIPAGLDVLHMCDTPLCINPAHLFLGTQADNNADRDRKGRQVSLRGSMNPRARIDESMVRVIIASDKSSLSLSKVINLDASAIRKIRRRESWRHVDV